MIDVCAPPILSTLQEYVTIALEIVDGVARLELAIRVSPV
jgi:hypothetical protein